MKYKLLALDVDGTLVGPDGIVSAEIARAVASADAAGLRVCIATGRDYAEAVPIWRQVGLSPPYEPIILIGGALVSEPDTGRTLYQRTVPLETAWAVADAMGDAGYCAMAIVDAWRHGVDYYVATRGDVEAAERLWLSKMNARVRRVRRLADAPDMPAPLRVSAVAEPSAADGLAETLRARFDGRLTMTSIVVPSYGVMIVEAHAPGADKLTALTYVGQARGISRARMVVVGDDVNDLPMVRGAALGVAMPDSPADLRDAADHVATDGLAAFLDDLLAGRFD